ncbi:RNA polymerase III subunit C82 [Gryganskiella cystojenkinii]|nr:RNA polymerase III subunit C82 [Gryganskiella cystojenkinii]
MSSHENRLGRLIIREHFGPIVEKVANVLLRKGRMTVPMIAKTLEWDLKNTRQVRESLVVLMQHNLVVYAEAQERGRLATYYEVNRTELLNRAMIPKVLHSTKDWFEKGGVLVAQAILTHGKMTITDCIADITANNSSAEGRHALKTAFTRMVKEKCLIAVRPSDSLTAADRDMVEEKIETSKLTLPPTAAQKADIRRTIESRRGADSGKEIVGLKRTVTQAMGDYDDYDSTDKRRKVASSELRLLEEVESDVYFKINYERYTIRWRNIKISDLYRDRLNPAAGWVMKAIMELAEEKMINCKEEHSSPVNVLMLLNCLPKELDLTSTLEFAEHELGINRRAPSVNECLDMYIQILEEDLLRILRRDGGRSGQYILQLRTAAKVMRKQLLQHMVEARFGSQYVRIMNLLSERGKMEEKNIAKFSLLNNKEVRERLTTLCTFGVLNLQEVPKTQERAPSRTIYLWEVVEDRAATTLIDRLYHTMGNLRQRRFVEKAKRAVLLAKCERTDVKENDNLLTETDKAELLALNNILQMLEIQELRIAEMVVCLRDF